MNTIPKSEYPLVIRTDFSDQVTWEHIYAALQLPVDGFFAYVEILNDPVYSGITLDQLRKLLWEQYNHSFIFIVDRSAIVSPDHPLLVMKVYPKSRRAKRLRRTTYMSAHGKGSCYSDAVKTKMPARFFNVLRHSFRAVPSTIQSIENNLSIANLDFEDFAFATRLDKSRIFRDF